MGEFLIFILKFLFLLAQILGYFLVFFFLFQPFFLLLIVKLYAGFEDFFDYWGG